MIKRAARYLVTSLMALSNRCYNIFPQPGEDVTPLNVLAERWEARGLKLLKSLSDPIIDRQTTLVRVY
jgi:hypothetical protein